MFLNKRYIIDSNSQCNIYIIDVKTGEKKEFVSEFAIPGQITENDIIRFKNDVTIDSNEEYNQKIIQKLIEWSKKSPDYKSKKSEEQVQMEQKLTDESMNIFSNNIESIKSQITKKFPFSIISIFEKMSQEERNKTIKIRTQAEIKKMSEIAGLYEKIFRGEQLTSEENGKLKGLLSNTAAIQKDVMYNGERISDMIYKFNDAQFYLRTGRIRKENRQYNYEKGNF